MSEAQPPAPKILGVDWADPNDATTMKIRMSAEEAEASRIDNAPSHRDIAEELSKEMLAFDKVDFPPDLGIAAEVQAMEKKIVEQLGVPKRIIPAQRVSPTPMEDTKAKATAFVKNISQLIPDIEVVAINNTAVTPRREPKLDPRVEKKADDISNKFPPGTDLTKKLLHNPRVVQGSMGRKAARMQLKAARKLQMKHLKETGYFDKQRAEAAEKNKKP